MYEIAFFLKLPFTCYGMGCKRMRFRKFAIKDFFGDFLVGFFLQKEYTSTYDYWHIAYCVS